MKKQIVIFIVALFCVFQCGCAILQLPLTVMSFAKNLIGGTLQLLDKLPKPPPWVFF
ncbi:MAG: hypothetical protein JSV34_04070 [Candidatus Omnitrophota bacterium]|nr:MAG: hypothetical protein JSV34_04070 [Candidatus Omnitrophota bacterium]